jgi:signal peptidase II
LSLLAVAVLLVDQGTKAAAENVLLRRPFYDPNIVLFPGHLNLTVARNMGAAWGMLQATPAAIRISFFGLVTIVIVAIIFAMTRWLRPHQRLASYGFALMTGGMLGNQVDKIVRGHVLEFIDYRADWVPTVTELLAGSESRWGISDHFPTFNLADVAITAGGAFVLLGINQPPTFGVSVPFWWTVRNQRARRGFVLRWGAPLGQMAFLWLLDRATTPTWSKLVSSVSSVGQQLALVLAGVLMWFAIALATLHVAARVWHVGRRLTQASPEELRALDGRDPILFLRAFARDSQNIGARNSVWLWLPIGRSIVAYEPVTFEDALVGHLQWFGPPIAIGRPAERVPGAGAARAYASGDEWRERVRGLAGEAKIVVLVADNTPAIRWELSMIREGPGVERLLLVIPPGGPKGRARKRQPDWYAGWAELRREFSFLPEVDDTTAALRFPGGTPSRIQCRSARAWHVIDGIERALERQGLGALRLSEERQPLVSA